MSHKPMGLHDLLQGELYLFKRHSVIEGLTKLHSEDLHTFNLESNIIIMPKRRRIEGQGILHKL
jgi:hypothetical protein